MGPSRGTLTPVRAILFDIGDTLFRLDPMDEGDIRQRLTARMSAHLGVDAEDASRLARDGYASVIAAIRESYRTASTAEPSIASVAEPIFSPLGGNAGALAAEMDRIFGQADIARWVPNPERERHLAAFADAGLELAFVSNTLTSPELMRARLTEFGVLDFAKVHVFSVAVGERKPSPTIYRAALEGLGVSPQDALFVGDRVREDVIGPQSLGIRGVLTHEFRQEDPGESKPEGIIRSLPELWDLLE
jgi:putative hydrolase of the HAD superfamily